MSSLLILGIIGVYFVSLFVISQVTKGKSDSHGEQVGDIDDNLATNGSKIGIGKWDHESNSLNYQFRLTHHP